MLEIESQYNLSSAQLVATLLYDNDSGRDFKAVSTAKQEPMTYKLHLNETGTKAMFEIKVAVLSSQHEDSLFRVKVVATFSNRVEREIISEPIKTVSKPSQVGKERKKKLSSPEVLAQAAAKKQKRTLSDISDFAQPEFSSPSIINSSTTTTNPTILEAILRLEKEQREHKQMLSNLMVSLAGKKDQQVSLPVTTTSTTTTTLLSSSGEEELEAAFANFLNAYSKVNASERASKLRKIVTSSTAKDHVKNLVSDCQQILPGEISPLTECHCINCPAKKELDILDGFYAELSSSPSSDFSSDILM